MSAFVEPELAVVGAVRLKHEMEDQERDAQVL
jgi:hypothetical protein